jgi:branched-chain amino acid transport system ATP-binding protein
MPSNNGPILKIQNIVKNFGGVMAVNKLSLEMEKTDILGLLGPNGAGKTTVFNLITGVFPVTSGKIIFNNIEISHQPPHRIVQQGIARTYQNIRLFESMTVSEHIRFGQNCRIRSVLGNILKSEQEKSLQEEAEEILKFLGIWEFRNLSARSLPHGQQRRVEIGRALATRPLLLLLDEPTAGMTLAEKKEILDILHKIHEKGIGTLVIEHDMRVVRNTCNRIVMLNFGEKIAEGTPTEIYQDIKAKEIYLGKE